VFDVVFREVQDPLYHPERIPKISAGGEHLRNSYLIHVDAPQQRREQAKQTDYLTAVPPRPRQPKRGEEGSRVREAEEERATRPPVAFPKSPRPSGVIDPAIAADFCRTREITKAAREKAMKPFLRPEKSLRERGLL